MIEYLVLAVSNVMVMFLVMKNGILFSQIFQCLALNFILCICTVISLRELVLYLIEIKIKAQ